MKSLLRLPRVSDSPACDYKSTLRVASLTFPGVHFTIRTMSFGSRMELTRAVGDLISKSQFHRAQPDDLSEQAAAGLLACEAEQMYLRWGLAGVEGMNIDGEPATAELLINKGPEAFVLEVVAAIKHQAGLSDEERKN